MGKTLEVKLDVEEAVERLKLEGYDGMTACEIIRAFEIIRLIEGEF